MNLRACFFLLLGLVGITLPSLTKAESSEEERVGFEFALYFAPTPKADPEETLARLLKADFASFSSYTEIKPKWSPIADYAPPTPKSFRYLTVDMDLEQGAAIAESERVFVLGFQASRPDLLRANREANALALKLAESTGGFLWDEECRLLYSTKAWREKRVDTWQDDVPDVRGHVNMHAYRNPDLVRIITLGLRKFGLPDLVIAQTPSGESTAAGNAINACAQRMLEGQAFDDERFELVLADIRHEGMKKSALINPRPGATGRTTLYLKKTPAEDGDPANRLLALEFRDAEGRGLLEKQAAALASLYGAEDEIVERRAGDQLLKAASEKARAAFFSKTAQFRKGFQPNERLLVKTAFKTEGQVEYMWVEVTGWKVTSVDGILMNDARFDKTLRQGRRVSVKLADVYDYIHYKPDGSEEGNETGKVLKQGRD